ncbi:MAG TPA: alpha/beta hydrolase [Noviherbaspirillum sp.]|jgi:pimeloyl-ACP methyl ester carboxylesterase|uniref:esterase/lipase family protein n=1 Tax=Noviherbaspirillum sp. TaxID=1926288 RepID=UPI002DDD2781|nr:alpha/beta hydrolase [Noviherbaspirillum sp.]HEV2609959.1 alpha/beta hydrolase [Noviherbaspirillum sp.]
MHITNIQPSSPMLFAFEPVRSMMDFFAGQVLPLERLPKGDGHSVIVFPGLGASGGATAMLRSRLQQLDYEVHDWEHGINQLPNGDLETWITRLAIQLQRLVARDGRAVTLVGWSLGGLYARALLERYPAWVRQIITLGTPYAELRHTGAASASRSSKEEDAVAAVPAFSIYSKSDGVVAWQGCVPSDLPNHHAIAVDGVSHMGLVHHPEVLSIIAELLAGSTRDWLAHRPQDDHRDRGPAA